MKNNNQPGVEGRSSTQIVFEISIVWGALKKKKTSCLRKLKWGLPCCLSSEARTHQTSAGSGEISSTFALISRAVWLPAKRHSRAHQKEEQGKEAEEYIEAWLEAEKAAADSYRAKRRRAAASVFGEGELCMAGAWEYLK